MKVVLDTMLWVSYTTRRHGSRHRLIDRAIKAKVRLFVSDYILAELEKVLREDLGESARYALLARRAVLRRAKRVVLPKTIRKFLPGDPNDDAIVQTALTSKADYLVTADSLLLGLGKVQNMQIIAVKDFAQRLPMSR
jgi:putative PIN family toxin of toxin-antitoxin system